MTVDGCEILHQLMVYPIIYPIILEGFQLSKVVQDFFHRQYGLRYEAKNPPCLQVQIPVILLDPSYSQLKQQTASKSLKWAYLIHVLQPRF